MEITVIVGQAPASNLPVEYDHYLGGVDPDDIVYTASPANLQAVEEAIRIREIRGKGRITLVTCGPKRFETTLREYLSLGADGAVHICDASLEKSDVYAISLAIAQAVKKTEYDLIICGEWVDDFGSSVYLAPYIAQILNLPNISGVTKIEVPDSSREVIVRQKMPRGDRRILRCPLPCLLAVEEGINEPRYATFPDAIAGLSKEIQVLDAASLGLKGEELGQAGFLVGVVGYSPPRARVKKGLVIDTKLSAAERMKLVQWGGLSLREGRQLLTGEVGKLSEEIASILVSKGLIKQVRNKDGSPGYFLGGATPA